MVNTIEAGVAVPPKTEEPIRAEVFGIERLEQHARSLAQAQKIHETITKGRAILPRINKNGQLLVSDYRKTIKAVRNKSEITPAEEWLLDNFHIVDEQLREIRDHLPGSYYNRLPKIAKGHLEGYPRVYGLAWAYVAHTDSRFDLETLQRFVQAYQQVQPLTIGELWAVAIHLRVALVENLRRLSGQIIHSREARAHADKVAEDLLGLSGRQVQTVGEILGRLDGVPLSSAFAVQLVQRLRDQRAVTRPALTWLHKKLKAQGLSANEAVAREHQDQAAANVTVRNIITSMRWMSSIEWLGFFERVSQVDEVLRVSPGFEAMDFATRNSYRTQIELLSRNTGRSELEVAREAVRLSRETASKISQPRQTGLPRHPQEDPGYYLVSRGRGTFEKHLGFRPSLSVRLGRVLRSGAFPLYLGGVTALTGMLLMGLVAWAGTAGAVPWTVLLVVLGLLPASEIALALVNRFVPVLVPPRLLPKLELSQGVPAGLRTMVVVPTMISNRADIETQLDHLEVHYLSNPRGHLHFALITDWSDAPQEHMPRDEELLNQLAKGIARLNNRYQGPPEAGKRFYLFHRRRLWNKKEKRWIGWERKRGKLHELNRLLRGANDTSFLPIDGEPPQAPPDVRYVITLDADTRLPKETAYRLVGAMAHPLNRPRFDPQKGRVVEGYAIMQPRITPTLPTGPGSTTYQRIISGPGGVDPYAAAVSDVYQDLFDEGTYTGKGIYDVDVFETALEGKIPENALLSHDLFEGLFARTALVTDTELFEEFPSNYEVAAKRGHRWVRGDWQLLPWILGRARDLRDQRRRIPIPAAGRWKMMDNLRRSLTAPASYLLAVTSWTLPLESPLPWTMLVVGSILVPALIPVLDGLIPQRRRISKRSHLRAVGHDVVVGSSQTLLAITVLAHQAWLMTDAVARTLVRLYVTRRNLLEWVTAAQAGYGVGLSFRDFYLHLRRGVVLAGAAGLLVAAAKPETWFLAAPFLVLWGLSPVLAWRMSRPPKVSESQVLSHSETRSLRLIARRTWLFFEAFVNEEEHALPPDNLQEDPEPVTAHRTSPTNMGLYLLSTSVACDFGWIGILDMVEQIEATLETMVTMRRFRGHFLNWYDTQNLRPLEPRYVSTVDSGNLAGHLIALAQACRDLLQRPIVGRKRLEGIEDALQLLLGCIEEGEPSQRSQTVTAFQLQKTAESISTLLQNTPSTIPEWDRTLRELEIQADNLLDIARTLTIDRDDGSESEILVWVRAVRDSILSHRNDLNIILPWAHDSLPQMEPLEFLAGTDPTPMEIPDLCRAVHAEIENNSHGLETEQRNELLQNLENSETAAATLVHRISALALLAERLVQGMDFRLLFDASRKLFSIGYRVTEGELDQSTYDLLASEARLASFVAIAKGDASPRHWFVLGRSLTPIRRGSVLVSWSGSMFEYLMPLLVMRQPTGSLLDLTCRLVVQRQIRYGQERKVPWGVSESAYSLRDVELTYQYSDFGVPGLGFKRGLFEDVVVAPYATALAAMVDAKAALSNFPRLVQAGAQGRYGFYEALDFTPSRLPQKTRVSVVRAYMAHHQGMILVSLGNIVHDGLTRSRFHSHPMVQAAELLLQERTPRSVAVTRPRGEEVSAAPFVRDLVPVTLRRFESPHDITPRTHLLSNGRYTVMITAAGSGFSRWNDLAVTRWREDPTRDCWGSFLYLRDAETGEVWSAGFHPSGAESEHYEVVYSEDRAKITQHFRSLSVMLEIIVSPEDDAELRQLTVTNFENRDREIDITSYAEIVLASQAADEAHPAFSNLFVETEFVPDLKTLLATRRPRSPEDPQLWVAHVAVVRGETEAPIQYETDRARFLGRGRQVRTPLSIIDGGPLSNTTGPVLDPILSIRRRVTIPKGGTIHIVFTTLVASSRADALEIAEKYHQPATFERESSLAWTYAQARLHHLRITLDEAHLFQRLANRLLYTDPTLRAAPRVLARNRRGPSSLWAYGLSGDLPIVLVHIETEEERNVVRQLLRAHEYWHLKGLSADLVILNARGTSYTQDFQTSLEATVLQARVEADHEKHEHHGEVFVLRTDLLPQQDRILLSAAARVVIHAGQGTVSEHVARLQRSRPGPVPPRLRPLREQGKVVPPPALELEFYNGLGGFTPDGREYVLLLGKGQWTPAPWINVIANERFGFQVSESGAGYTWSENSRQNKLTSWSNDPVSDTPSETFYVRDEDSGLVWGPTILPIREEAKPYVVHHGQGYSRFEHTSHGIALELLQFVPVADPVKISRLTLVNQSNHKRRLTVSAYVEWVLGVSRPGFAPFVVTKIDSETGALFATNVWNEEFGDRVAFADLAGEQTSWTGNRLEFLGRNAYPDHPASLERGNELSGTTGAGFDPCAVLQRQVELEPGEVAEVVFFLGQEDGEQEARALIKSYRRKNCDEVLSQVREYWNRLLGTVQVKTPDRSMDVLLNRWLLYQTLSCRIWARSAFYQSGGAYGFRDQLQDVMALAVTKPEILRKQLLRAAARQFPEGDVQHWWHLPSGTGVRTRMSDDRLWLPYALVQYLRVTGDSGVLDESAPWLEGPALEEHQQEAFYKPKESPEQATLYEHSARALDRSLLTGGHGLPLIGAGDWNDGMNRVGFKGQGESVWLGWFLIANLEEWARLADLRGDGERAIRWRTHTASLNTALEKEAWDGAWYRRAYFDDGTPLGSVENEECQIDSIAQSWAVLSGAGDPARARRAMESVEERLVRRDDRLVLLFSPPFAETHLDPGYIKGYVPGIRENGGQYTHAAIWSILAWAGLGEGDKAVDLFALLNPIHHAVRLADVDRYKVEPYVVAADIYSEPPHVGRGGWTWYTGASGWLYRAGVEWILGFRKEGSVLRIDPCIPQTWKTFEIIYQHGDAVYRISVENPEGVCRGVVQVSIDGIPLSGEPLIPLNAEGGEHHVQVVLG